MQESKKPERKLRLLVYSCAAEAAHTLIILRSAF